jgi:hypothetical protein
VVDVGVAVEVEVAACVVGRGVSVAGRVTLAVGSGVRVAPDCGVAVGVGVATVFGEAVVAITPAVVGAGLANAIGVDAGEGVASGVGVLSAGPPDPGVFVGIGTIVPSITSTMGDGSDVGADGRQAVMSEARMIAKQRATSRAGNRKTHPSRSRSAGQQRDEDMRYNQRFSRKPCHAQWR